MTRFTRRVAASTISPITAVIALASATPSGAVTIGAYAVANHSSCGAGNIPGTIAELDKFFASGDLPSDFQKNFYWKDTRVRQTEWTKDGDYKDSSETTSGFDGSDASILTYIASHGVTSGGVYKALSGSKNNGGCYIPTTNLELGNHTSRYTILSTCQGLKIGTGDYPNSNGENPSRTWKNSSKGLNCIFGYSNNMADADQYGEYLLNNIKDGTTPLSLAFLDASEAVSPDNIPAVMCYGATEQDASDYLQNNTVFESQSRSNAASAWIYRVVETSKSNVRVSSGIPAALRLKAKSFNAQKIAQSFLGASLSKASKGNTVIYSGSAGSLTLDKKSGVLTISNDLVDDVRSAPVPSQTESLEIARHALKISGLSALAGDTTLVETSEDVLGGAQGIKSIVSRKFIFKQNLAGAFTLSQQGSIAVTVGAGGTVTSIKSALLEIDPVFKATSRDTDIAKRKEDIETSAIETVASRAPGANYKVTKYRVGYDAGNFHKANQIAPAVVEVTVEATQGEFTRKFITKIAL